MSYTLVKQHDPILREIAKPIYEIDERIRYIASRMFSIIDSKKAVGLAAPQIGVSIRLIVVNTNTQDGLRIALVNPTIMLDHENSSVTITKGEEMCLSCPGVVKEVYRQHNIILMAERLDGSPIVIDDLEGFNARVIQHEIDHLNGILITDKK